METAEIKGLEQLMEQEQLVAPIKYSSNPTKEQFFSTIKDWSVKRGTEIKEKQYGFFEGWKNSLKDLIYFLETPNSELKKKEISSKERYYLIYANLGDVICPFAGVWVYNHRTKEIFKGGKISRCISYIQADYLIHEYLHAYQHLLYDHLTQEGLTKEGYKNPGSMVEPPQLGFQFRPPSYKKLKKFENKIIKELINIGYSNETKI